MGIDGEMNGGEQELVWGGRMEEKDLQWWWREKGRVFR